VEEGAVKLIEALPLPAVAVPMVGAPGAVTVLDELLPLLEDEPPPPHPVSIAPTSSAALITSAFDKSLSMPKPPPTFDCSASRTVGFG
jgi:hypothetical protein